MGWSIAIHQNGVRFENASWNYTHNTNNMMRKAGYDWIYHLDDQRVLETLPKFRAMLSAMKSDPEAYRDMNPKNGWGDYDRLVRLWETDILPKAEWIIERVPDAQWWEWWSGLDSLIEENKHDKILPKRG